MKKILVAGLLASVSTAAISADLPSRKAAPAYEPLPPVMSWAGPSVGIQLGGVFGSGSTNASSWGSGGGGCGAGNPIITTATSDPVSVKPDYKKIDFLRSKPPVSSDPVVSDPIVVDSSVSHLGNPCPSSVSTSSVTTTQTGAEALRRQTQTQTQTTTVTTTTNPAFPLPNGGSAAAATNGNVGGSKGAFIGGGAANYRWQSGSFVYGVEASISGLAGGGANGTISGVSNDGSFSYLGTTHVTRKLNWLGTFNGQIGYAIMPQLLIFADGGLAFGGVSSHTNIWGSATPVTGTWAGGSWFGDQGINSTRVGWNAGAGAEYMVNPNWSVRLSYTYYDLGSANYNVAWGGAGMAGSTQIHNRFNGNIVQAGIFWHPWR